MKYLTQKEAIKSLDQMENEAIANGRMFPRLTQLNEVRRFIRLYHQGNILKITLRRKSLKGTLLGFCVEKKRGWQMAILTTDGGVKNITIDPHGYADENDWVELMEDRESKYIALITPNDTILTISP